MNTLYGIERAFFIGIGGIGMSALARYFNATGIEVAGYDRVSTTLTDRLSGEGMSIHFTDDISLLPPAFRKPQGTLVIFTPAVPATHRELVFFREHHFRVLKRSEALGLIVKGMKVIAVAGTHGKTTISSMITHILSAGGIKTNAFLGGISTNLGTNFLFSPESDLVVVEADEYDRSFLKLYPDMAVLTAMDADHLDIYGDRKALLETYGNFVSQIRDGGTLLLKQGLSPDHTGHLKTFTYGLSGEADFHPREVIRQGFRYRFSLSARGEVIRGLTLGVYGKVNLENAVAACSVALLTGAGEEALRKGLEGYSGVKRRFEVMIERPDCVFIDDYAHHPEELKAFISSVSEALPGKRLTGIFQPHLYSRTRDFAAGFAESLSALDDVIVLDIYPAREEPIEGVGPELILGQLKNPGEKIHCSKARLLQVIDELNPEVLLTMGAGDIDQLTEPLKELLQNKHR